MDKCRINKPILEHLDKNIIQKFFLNLLPKISKYLLLNKKKHNKNYPQTWWYIPLKKNILRITLQKFCSIFTGHELSNTEWGYGGGRFLIRNCRWCGKAFKVPKNEEPTKRNKLEDIASI